MDDAGLVTLDEVRAAAAAIAPFVRRTPLLPYEQTRDDRVWLKAESLQLGGSFKLRGAMNALSRLSPSERRRGVITHSSGNHAQAVARAGRAFGVEVTVVMPRSAARVKVDATRAHGAEVVLVEPADRELVADEIRARTGAVLVPPFDAAAVIAGQGTVGVEIAEQLPAVRTVYVPVGGGGLMSGVAVAVRALLPGVRLVAVEPELAADFAEGWARGERVRWAVEATARTMADGLRVTAVGDLNWAHLRALVDDVVTVTEAQIADALRRLVVTARLVSEPSGAVALAGLLADETRADPSVAVVTGSNVDPAVLASVLAPTAG